MKVKKIMAIAISLGLIAGTTTVPTFAADKKHLYLVILLLMQKMKKQISTHRTLTQDGHVSAMVLEKHCFVIQIPWKSSHGWQRSMKI